MFIAVAPVSGAPLQGERVSAGAAGAAAGWRLPLRGLRLLRGLQEPLQEPGSHR